MAGLETRDTRDDWIEGHVSRSALVAGRINTTHTCRGAVLSFVGGTEMSSPEEKCRTSASLRHPSVSACAPWVIGTVLLTHPAATVSGWTLRGFEQLSGHHVDITAERRVVDGRSGGWAFAKTRLSDSRLVTVFLPL